MSTVLTVLGPVHPSALGRVMPHEHLLSLTPGPWLGDAVALAIAALQGLRELGFGTVVDLSPYGVVGRTDDGSNVELLRDIARATGLHIVAGTAVYLESFSPAWALDASLPELTARLIADVTTGIGSSGVPAGILGEQATSLGAITPHEQKCLRAAARAANETGVALYTHTTHGTMALEQLEILSKEGADLDRVVIGHLDTHADPEHATRVLDGGALIAVDTIGKQEWDYFLGRAPERDDGDFTKRAYHRSDAGRADMVANLVERGYGDRIILAQDLTGAEVWMNPTTHGEQGYRYLAEVFVPMLRDRGVTDAQCEQMLSATPTRLLTVS